jgi:hypothetical protein
VYFIFLDYLLISIRSARIRLHDDRPNAVIPVFWLCQVHTADDEVFWRKDGTSFPVEYTSIPIKDKTGKSQTNFRFISSHVYKTAEGAGT